MIYDNDKYLNEIEGIFNNKELEDSTNIVITFSSSTLGNTEKELGSLLMETYLHTLTKFFILPKTIILYGSSVLFATNSSTLNIYIKKLIDKGVEILVCSTSARYYNIEKIMNVGHLVNMQTILERKMSATKLINL